MSGGGMYSSSGTIVFPRAIFKGTIIHRYVQIQIRALYNFCKAYLVKVRVVVQVHNTARVLEPLIKDFYIIFHHFHLWEEGKPADIEPPVLYNTSP